MAVFITVTLAVGLLALAASLLLLVGFRFERFVGTRYLRREMSLRTVRVGLLIAMGVTAADLLVMLAARGHNRTAETIAVVIALGALLTTILLVLLRFFSVFTTVSTVGVMLGVSSLIVVLSVTSGVGRRGPGKRPGNTPRHKG